MLVRHRYVNSLMFEGKYLSKSTCLLISSNNFPSAHLVAFQSDTNITKTDGFNGVTYATS